MTRRSFTDRVEEFFRARPGQWVSATQLEVTGGRFAWRTRVSDCRVQRGLTIENRVRRVARQDGTTYTVSEYRYLPKGQGSLLEVAS